MPSAVFILYPGAVACRIARCDGASVLRLESPTMADVPGVLAANGYGGGPVTLAICAGDCLAARISTGGLPRADRKAMLYRLEEKLPVAAEEIVADFVAPDGQTADGGNEALGVCALLGRVRPIVDALEDAGVAVGSIVPASLAAAAGFIEALASRANPILLLLSDRPAAGQAMVSLIAMRDARPFDWAYVPATLADVRLQLELLSGAAETFAHVVAVGIDRSLTDALAAESGGTIEVNDGSIEDVSARYCANALAGRARLPIELRRDALAAADRFRQFRRPLNALLATAALALAATAAVLFVRAQRYAHLDAEMNAQIATEFRAHFPGWAMPANVRAVIESEHRRAAALNVGASPAIRSDRAASSAAWYGSAFTVFRDVIVNLPADGHFFMDRMSFQDASFELAGRLQSYDEVDSIAAAARRSGMSVTPPQTRRDAGGTWTFVVEGTRPAGGGGAR